MHKENKVLLEGGGGTANQHAIPMQPIVKKVIMKTNKQTANNRNKSLGNRKEKGKLRNEKIS